MRFMRLSGRKGFKSRGSGDLKCHSMDGLVCTAWLRMYPKGIAASLQDATVSNLRIRRRACQSRRLWVALIIQLRIDRRTGMLQVVGQKIICRIQSIGDQNQHFRLGLFAPVSMLLMCRPVICTMFLSWFGTDWDTVRFQTLHALYTKSFRVNTQKYDEFHLLSMAQCGTIDSSKKAYLRSFILRFSARTATLQGIMRCR